jgi:hypothetical protein
MSFLASLGTEGCDFASMAAIKTPSATTNKSHSLILRIHTSQRESSHFKEVILSFHAPDLLCQKPLQHKSKRAEGLKILKTQKPTSSHESLVSEASSHATLPVRYRDSMSLRIYPCASTFEACQKKGQKKANHGDAHQEPGCSFPAPGDGDDQSQRGRADHLPKVRTLNN